MQDDDNNRGIRLVGAVAGMGSGIVAVGHGFDTVKTRMQCTPPGVYNGAIDCLVKTVRSEGVLALYKGATPPAVGWAAIDSVLLGSLHNYRLFLRKSPLLVESSATDPSGRLSLLGHGLAGLLAGCTSAFIATPIELVKVKLQLQQQASKLDREFKGPIHCARSILQRQGIPGLWSGLSGSIAFRANFSWMFFSIEWLMRSMSRLEGTPYEMNVGTATFLAGGLGSFAFWIAAIPADNIKNRMMASPLNHRPSFLGTISSTYSMYGVPGFYRGLAPSLLRAFPVNASAYFVYESLLRLFRAEKTRS